MAGTQGQLCSFVLIPIIISLPSSTQPLAEFSPRVAVDAQSRPVPVAAVVLEAVDEGVKPAVDRDRHGHQPAQRARTVGGGREAETPAQSAVCCLHLKEERRVKTVAVLSPSYSANDKKESVRVCLWFTSTNSIPFDDS